MLNAEFLLAALQWALILIGGAICLGVVVSLLFPGEVSTFTYIYPDGRTVEATPTDNASAAYTWTSAFMGFGIGLMTMALGAMLFCLRRIGSCMGQMRDEMREMQDGGS